MKAWKLLFLAAIICLSALAVVVSCGGDDPSTHSTSSGQADDDDHADDDTAPVDDDTFFPWDDDTAPVDDDTFPSDDDTAPVDDDTFPSDDDTQPADDDVDDDADEETVTVLTINLQNPLLNPFQVNERTQIVADLIVERQPDFVALQEVVQSLLMENRAEVLANLTGYNWIWEQTHDVPLLFEEGIGILTPWPVAWSEAESLPHTGFIGMFSRAILGIGATLPFGEFLFFCSHMTVNDNPAIKADQALAALDFIESHSTGLPGVFAGDLNAEPDSLAMKMLRGEEDHQGRHGDFLDAWIEANDPDPGYTFSSDNPRKRIDYVYLVPSDAADAEVETCELVFTEPVGGIFPSDHIGVFCTFAIPSL